MKPFAITAFSLVLAASHWSEPAQPVDVAQQFSNQCITPFSFCYIEVLLPVGTPCFCPDGQGGIIQF